MAIKKLDEFISTQRWSHPCLEAGHYRTIKMDPGKEP
jgi:hypothetical protein